MFKTFRSTTSIAALVLVLTLATSLALPTAVAARGGAQDPNGAPSASAAGDGGLLTPERGPDQDPNGVPGTLERGPDQDPNGLRAAPVVPADGVAASMRSLIDPSLSL
jgi:hypothetical protein